jgi:polysaccharide pyruvyl transferase WcaK-like protein
MRIHHFYPRTPNIGDHFVQRGIAAMLRRIVPDATFKLFDVNSRGQDKKHYGLTQSAVQLANEEADLIIVGGSNLYEGGFRWPWGVHLDVEAIANLQIPLFLIGVGTGSDFGSPLHTPSARARFEIKLLNEHASLSGARDIVTLDWLHRLGVAQAKLSGDPATFIFNNPLQQTTRSGHVLITLPPRRTWSSKRNFWKVRTQGRPAYLALVELTRTLLKKGEQVVVACNDPMDLSVAQKLFNGWLPRPVVCPKTPEEYFELLSNSRASISGRLHTSVVAFSLGIPFLLVDIDQRTHGFLKTYEMETASVIPSRLGVARLNEQVDRLLRGEPTDWWESRIAKRNELYNQAMKLLETALEPIRSTSPAAP